MPHSEIFGSKPIPGSPKLIAGYHVLHRLLLPRHPPNALIALDLIQKEQDYAGSRSPGTGPFVSPVSSWSKAFVHSFRPMQGCGMCLAIRRSPAVSVLDLDSFMPAGLACRCRSNASASHEADVSLSIHDVKEARRPLTSERTTEPAIRWLGDPFRSGVLQVALPTQAPSGPRPIEPGADVSRRSLATFCRRPARRVCEQTRRGGAYRDRTDDLLNANQALSQLS